MSKLPQLWLNDEKQELVRYLMTNTHWSSKEIGDAWGELQVDLERLEKTIWNLMNDAERIKYYFARRCYVWRDKVTPKGQIPWPQHFEEVYGQSLESYMQQCVKLNTKQRVMEHEIATFGHSRLQTEEAA